MAFHLMQRDQRVRACLVPLMEAWAGLCATLRAATYFTRVVCPICQDAGRDAARLCVVETPADQQMNWRMGAVHSMEIVLLATTRIEIAVSCSVVMLRFAAAPALV